VKILIIPDSFKGSLSAKEVAQLMEQCVKAVFPESESVSMPFSDGGEGALTVLQTHSTGQLIKCSAYDALQKPIEASYFFFQNKNEVWIELSQTAGLTLLNKTDLDPLNASTWGTGKMIEHALDKGNKKIYLGIGGSATQDLGTGIITALGGRFLDENDKELPLGGGALYRLKKIDLSNLNARALQAQWVIACDVQNPLLGKEGTAHTYAKQKGASPSDIDRLEQGGNCFAEVVKNQFGIEIRNLTGGGAAGGVSAGLFALLNASLTNGFELLAQQTGLKDKISKFDFILTGEGSFDEQSLYGKLPIQVARLAEKSNIPTLIVAGFSKMKSLKHLAHCTIINTTPPGVAVEKAIENAEKNLRSALTKELEFIKSHNL